MRWVGIFLLATLLCMLCSHLGWRIGTQNIEGMAMHAIRGSICVLVAHALTYLFRYRTHMQVDYDTQEQQYPWPDHQSWEEKIS
jgi:dolichyl-phosphate-mannose--protein O-mannosyl transferase